MEVVPYSEDAREKWDAFVAGSKNATFLFFRDYMEYHKDRFQDKSLLIYDEKQRLLALFPATHEHATVTSHGGLTYGGLLVDERMTAALALETMQAIAAYLRQEGFELLRYKAIPYIYHRMPAQEDLYALFRMGARLYRRDIATTVALRAPASVQKRRLRGARKAQKSGVVCRETDAWGDFWRLLERNLAERHRARPVHSLKEILYLHQHFPANIRLFGAFLKENIVGGTVIYETDQVAHAQYIASAPEGREVHALDALFLYLLQNVYADKPYFDFGISTERGGTWLNEGLSAFKEGFGGRGVVYDFYEMEL